MNKPMLSFVIPCYRSEHTIGAVVKELQVEMGERIAGTSYLNFARSVEYMIKMGLSILLIQWFRKRDTLTPYTERSL